MMDSSQYPEEQEYLKETVKFIDSEIQRLKGPPPWAAHNETARLLKEMNDEKLERYQTVRPRPYFGRLDFVPEDGGQPIEAYIGTGHVAGRGEDYVYDWRDPFPGQLFYTDPHQVASYQAPRGEIRGTITLKRQYVVEDAQLLDVTEVYRSVELADGRKVTEDSSESFMTRQLSRSRGGELLQAVATLQWDQYQQIAAAREQVMVVQGVAGSGKSIVGLHRVAYLLSPLNVGPDRIRASQVIIFGPTRPFLRYVANLLPSIDVRNVPQATVRDWLQGTLSRRWRVYLDRKEPLLEKLLKHKGKQWQDAHQAARLKGSLQMSQTLDRHIQARRKQFAAAATPLAIRIDSVTPIVLDATKVRRVMRSVSKGPLNIQRERTIDRLLEELWGIYGRQANVIRSSRLRKTHQEFVEQARPQVEQQVAMFWPELDFR
jgi:DNA helicase-2/ATP-dependent DNA helicase PcrA